MNMLALIWLQSQVPGSTREPSMPVSWHELVQVHDLVVREGGRSEVTTDNIALSISPQQHVNDDDELIVFRLDRFRQERIR